LASSFQFVVSTENDTSLPRPDGGLLAEINEVSRKTGSDDVFPIFGEGERGVERLFSQPKNDLRPKNDLKFNWLKKEIHFLTLAL
jgi:hypothetical protein